MSVSFPALYGYSLITLVSCGLGQCDLVFGGAPREVGAMLPYRLGGMSSGLRLVSWYLHRNVALWRGWPLCGCCSERAVGMDMGVSGWQISCCSPAILVGVVARIGVGVGVRPIVLP